MSVHVRPICHIHVHYFPPLHVRQSICNTLPCTVFLCQLYLYVSTPTYPSHSYAQCLPYMSVLLRPYVRIQLCVRMSVYHYYTSLSYISTTVCRSTCLCVCLFSCKYIILRHTGDVITYTALTVRHLADVI